MSNIVDQQDIAPQSEETASSSTGYYGMNETPQQSEQDAKVWSNQQDDGGEPEDLRAREEKDDAEFEKQSKMPFASDPNTDDEDKSLLQKGIDKIAGLNTEAGKEYLAS